MPTDSNAVIDVVVGCDDGYAPQLAVLLVSLFTHSKSPALRVHVLVPRGFSGRPKLDQAVGDRAGDLTYITLSADTIADPAYREYITSATYFRCYIGMVLPVSIRRVIYIDFDTIVRRDLAELWEVPLRGHILAAAFDPAFDRHHILGLPRAVPCFNSGVMLVDLRRWREERIGEAALDFAIRYPERLSYNDQCAINWVLRGLWLELDPRWNVMFCYFSNELKGEVGYIRPVPPLAAAAWIVHFNAPGRPWLYLDSHPFKTEFQAYLARTPWRGSGAIGRHPGNMLLKAMGQYGLVARHAVQQTYWRLRKRVGR